MGVKSRINVVLRAARGAAGAAVLVVDGAGVDEDAPEPQPADTAARAAKAARRQAVAVRARIAPRIRRARIGARWSQGVAT